MSCLSSCRFAESAAGEDGQAGVDGFARANVLVMVSGVALATLGLGHQFELGGGGGGVMVGFDGEAWETAVEPVGEVPAVAGEQFEHGGEQDQADEDGGEPEGGG